MSRLSRQCAILNNSQPYRPPRPVTGIALLYFTIQNLSKYECNLMRSRVKKVRFSLCLINNVLWHKDVLEEWSCNSTVLVVGASRWWVISFTPQPLYSREEEMFPVLIIEKFGWALELVWTLWGIELSFSFAGNWTVAYQPVPMPTEPN
jgi:hypothetical protein